MSDFLFVYGTLRRNGGNRMHGVLLRHAYYVGTATYQGRLYEVSHYPGVVPSKDPSDLVWGEIFRLSNPALTLPRIDRYEGCGPGFPEPNEYIRVRQNVSLSSGDNLSAWIYLYNRPVQGLKRVKSGDFNKQGPSVFQLSP